MQSKVTKISVYFDVSTNSTVEEKIKNIFHLCREKLIILKLSMFSINPMFLNCLISKHVFFHLLSSFHLSKY